MSYHHPRGRTPLLGLSGIILPKVACCFCWKPCTTLAFSDWLENAATKHFSPFLLTNMCDRSSSIGHIGQIYFAKSWARVAAATPAQKAFGPTLLVPRR